MFNREKSDNGSKPLISITFHRKTLCDSVQTLRYSAVKTGGQAILTQ